jgi:DNA-binding SARP family transcriptional activator
MEFRPLGPLEIVERDRSLALGAGKRKALLAILLLNANEVVSTESPTRFGWSHTVGAA